MRILFTRHGESGANLLHEISNRGLGLGLTRQGRQQALALARRLADLHLERIYSGPLLRAIETSVIVANQLDADYEVAEALREYDCGILEGRSDDAAWQLWQELSDAWLKDGDWGRRIEGGESGYEVQNRFVTFIDELTQQYGDTDANLLCVSHGGLYWVALPRVLVNVDLQFITARNGFGYAPIIVSEWTPQGLACREWNGDAVDG